MTDTDDATNRGDTRISEVPCACNGFFHTCPERGGEPLDKVTIHITKDTEKEGC